VVSYALKRLLRLPAILLLVMLVVFLLVQSAGNVVDLLLPPEATASQRADLAHQLGLDKPLFNQFVTFVGHTLRGDFGHSVYYHESAASIVAARLPASLMLAGLSIIVATVLGVGLGILGAVRVGGPVDALVNTVAVVGQSMPSFWLGQMLILVFAVKLQLLPTSGYTSVAGLLLPTLTLSAFLVPQILLLTRTGMIESLQQPYMVTAQAKGLPPRLLVLRHALRNALNPIIASIGLQLGTLLGGAVLTESVFGWPGVGRLGVEAILHRDLPVVEATVVLLAVVVMLTNLAVDLLSASLDPRIRVS
jgi:ABC-type dipeptide/oligopeptide/nickel transport system permease component